MLLEQKANLAKAHQSKSPSSSFTSKQVHSSDRDGERLLTFGNSSCPFFAVKQKNLEVFYYLYITEVPIILQMHWKCFSTYILQANPVNVT